MALWHIFSVLLFSSFGAESAIFTLRNACNKTIWPGILAGGGHPQLLNGALQLNPLKSTKVTAPKGWSGSFWARDGCSFEKSGKGKCNTGDCGNVLQCNGSGGLPPVSLAEFTLDSPIDFYDVSLVDGYNIPVSILPSGGTGNCSKVKCLSDLNLKCPAGLQVKGDNGKVVACKSACMTFDKDEYCCRGKYDNSMTCKPSKYSKIFKVACPTSYSYPYDDPTSIFTCQGANYFATFFVIQVKEMVTNVLGVIFHKLTPKSVAES